MLKIDEIDKLVLLRTFSRPSTIQELSRICRISQERCLLRVKRLESHGFLRVIETRKEGVLGREIDRYRVDTNKVRISVSRKKNNNKIENIEFMTECELCGSSIPLGMEKCPLCETDFVHRKVEEEVVGVCPTCSAYIPPDSAMCPICGQIFAGENVEPGSKSMGSDCNIIVEGYSGKVGGGESLSFTGEELEKTEEISSEDSRKGLALFYIGLAFVLLGSSVAVSSWLHDWLRIPLVGVAFETFGHINRFVASVGLAVLSCGIAFLILSSIVERLPLGFAEK